MSTDIPLEYPLWGMTAEQWAGMMGEEVGPMIDGRAFDGEAMYEIRVQGHLDAGWSAWFDGWTIRPEAGGETVLCGPVADQAALHGLLARIRDLGLPLLAVVRREG